jgi:amidohydrolase
MDINTEALREIYPMKSWLIDTRRAFHTIPEPGDKEYKTQAEVCRILDELGISYRKGSTSVVAHIKGPHGAPVVALRADMDALPVNEPLDRTYRSGHEGFMHACGHDAHMTIALGAARYFAEHRNELKGSVVFLFQPAEESTGGALPMIKAGCLENPHVDYVLGLHVMPDVPVGMVEVKYGAINAAADTLRIAVKGRGAHAAYPDTGIDAVLIAAKVVDALQSIVSRNVSPLSEAVITLGTIHGGTQNNIIADEVIMTGTVRTTEPEVRAMVIDRVKTIVHGVSEALGGSAELDITPGYGALINHDRIVDLIVQEAASILGKDAIRWKKKPSLGVEDFSFYVMERPGAFYNLGCGNPEKGITAALHSNRFDIDEDCLPIGVAVQVAAAKRLLAIQQAD